LLDLTGVDSAAQYMKIQASNLVLKQNQELNSKLALSSRYSSKRNMGTHASTNALPSVGPSSLYLRNLNQLSCDTDRTSNHTSSRTHLAQSSARESQVNSQKGARLASDCDNYRYKSFKKHVIF
jgi:hypothetical protein